MSEMEVAFFVTGHGRSGTLWLAKLLNCDSTIAVHHEPIQSDKNEYARIHSGQDATEYLLRRKEQMRKIWERTPWKKYAEVNSYLRYCVPELESVFQCPVVTIIRDGKYVVRSMMARGCYQKPGYPLIEMPGNTPFEKCCAYWADTYERLQGSSWIFYLEFLNQSYAYVQVLERLLDISIPKAIWQRFANKPENVGVGDKAWDWTTEQEETFKRIAGDVYGRYYGEDYYF